MVSGAPHGSIMSSGGTRVVAKILLVDDDAEILALLAEYLAEDYEVITAESGEDALAITAEFAILVTDYLMPGINGLQLADEMMARHPARRAILISGSWSDTQPPAEYPFLRKPFRLHELTTLIEQVRQ